MKNDRSWGQLYLALLNFKRRTGHCRVPGRYPEHPDLPRWLTRQLSLGEALPLDRLEKLHRIGVRFPPFHKTGAWIVSFFEWKRLKKRWRHWSERGKRSRVAKWVFRQRTRRQKGSLTLAQIRLLDAIGFDWRPSRDILWEQRFQELKVLIEKRSKGLHSRTIGDLNLSGWYWRQRRRKLSSQQRRLLLELGIPSRSPFSNFNERLERLRQFKRQHGHCHILPSDDPSLSAWLRDQRGHKNRLSPEQRHDMDELGIVWAPLEAEWETQYRALSAFRQRHGHCDIRRHNTPNKRLLGWVQTQKVFWSRGKLPKDRQRRLERLGFIRNAKEATWDEFFARLQAFKKSFGHCDVRLHNAPDQQFVAWILRQREFFHHGKLAKDRQRHLEQIGFIWDAKQMVWEEHLRRLQMFRKRFGHLQVPRSSREFSGLRCWVYWQRRYGSEGRLDPKRRAKLDAIGLFEKRREGA